MRIFNKVTKWGFLIVVLLFIYYQIDYKRHFIHNEYRTESFTLWQRFGNNCYIIPGKYNWIFPPKNNFIKTVNYRNYIGVIWNTDDEFDYKVSIYNNYEPVNLNKRIKLYDSNDSLLLEYQILDTLIFEKGKRTRSDSSEYYSSLYDYNYIDLNRIIGIKVYRNSSFNEN